MNAEEHRAWSDAVFDARYIDMDEPKQLVQKFAILSANTELHALRAEVTLLRPAVRAARVYRDTLVEDDEWSSGQIGHPWVDPNEAGKTLDAALAAAGFGPAEVKAAPPTNCLECGWHLTTRLSIDGGARLCCRAPGRPDKANGVASWWDSNVPRSYVQPPDWCPLRSVKS